MTKLRYGDEVMCVDPESPWYCQVGQVVVMNKTNCGVRYPGDPEPPATGRWHPKGMVKRLAELLESNPSPYLRSIHVLNNRKDQGFDIDLSPGATASTPNHLIITGRNGSGKSSILEAIRNEIFPSFAREKKGRRLVRLRESNPEAFIQENAKGPAVWVSAWSEEHAAAATVMIGRTQSAFFQPFRRFKAGLVSGPAALDWVAMVSQDSLHDYFLQHLVNRRFDQLAAQADDDEAGAARAERWFTDVQAQFQRLFEDDGLVLELPRGAYRHRVRMGDGRSVDLDVLPDGFASVLCIFAELLLREDAHRRQASSAETFRGFVLIDEIEAHLHLSLQRKILPLLTDMFPHLQFIVTTHSAAVVASLDNAVVYDLERHQTALGRDLRGHRYGNLVMGHFGLPSDLDMDTTERLGKLKALARLPARTPEEERELADLRALLSARSQSLAAEIWEILDFPLLVADGREG